MPWEALGAILVKLLGWLFSGSESTTIEHTPGLEGLDRKTLSGVDE